MLTLIRPRLFFGAIGALCLGATTAAWAQEPAPATNGYICLSNSCVTQKAVAAPGPAQNRPAPPVLGAAPQTKESLLASLTEEQRSTAQVTETVRNGMVTIEVQYQTANGGRGSRMIRYAQPPSQ